MLVLVLLSTWPVASGEGSEELEAEAPDSGTEVDETRGAKTNESSEATEATAASVGSKVECDVRPAASATEANDDEVG